MENFEEMHKFSNIIFDKVKSSKLEYLDAIVSYCSEKELEVDSIISLISPALKSKMEEEAIGLRLIKNSSPRLTF
jgi:hypothetical protein